ncbi:MAG TPA: efflux RND transporter periplasmic adaptor subunit, partial [Chthonomonadales bacterium]|nr:efflux RND transporter periplasmic adaptor subunit [Chthonomonadales bacterium]
MKRWFTAGIAVAVMAALVIWRLHSNALAAAAASRQRAAMMKIPPSVAVAPAAVRDIVSTFEAVGNVDPSLNVRLAGRVTGRILSLSVHEGDPVRKG